MSSTKSLNKFNNIYKKNIISNDDIKEIKQNAWDLFNKNGLPPSSHTNELWKYTNFSDLKKIDFDNAYKTDFIVKDNLNVLKNDQWNNIYIINGFFDESQSNYSNEIVVENFSNLNKLKYLSKKIGSSNITDLNPSFDLAKWIKFIPVIYYPFGLQSAANRFKNSLQENSKIHVIAEDVIEACHNGVVAWEKKSDAQPILIRGQDDHIKTKERHNIMKKFFQQNNIQFREIYSVNGSILTKIISW